MCTLIPEIKNSRVPEFARLGFQIGLWYYKSLMSEFLEPVLSDLNQEDLGLFSGKIHYYSEVDSTNNVAKVLADEGADEGTVLIAETQTHGRGRQARAWFSSKSTGLYLSIILRPKVPPVKVPTLTLLSAVVVSESLDQAIKAIAMNQPVVLDVKWPNDVLINSKKVCGILSEMAMKENKGAYVIVGIGININSENFPPPLSAIATSLYLETGIKFARVKILGLLLKTFQAWYKDFVAQNFDAIFRRWCELSTYAYGKKIRFEKNGDMINGTTRGLNDEGALLVEKTDGSIEAIFAADIYDG